MTCHWSRFLTMVHWLVSISSRRQDTCESCICLWDTCPMICVLLIVFRSSGRWGPVRVDEGPAKLQHKLHAFYGHTSPTWPTQSYLYILQRLFTRAITLQWPSFEGIDIDSSLVCCHSTVQLNIKRNTSFRDGDALNSQTRQVHGLE